MKNIEELRKIEADEMTMHDVFTCFALAGIISQPIDVNGHTSRENIVDQSRKVADEMLIQRSK